MSCYHQVSVTVTNPGSSSSHQLSPGYPEIFSCLPQLNISNCSINKIFLFWRGSQLWEICRDDNVNTGNITLGQHWWLQLTNCKSTTQSIKIHLLSLLFCNLIPSQTGNGWEGWWWVYIVSNIQGVQATTCERAANSSTPCRLLTKI